MLMIWFAVANGNLIGTSFTPSSSRTLRSVPGRAPSMNPWKSEYASRLDDKALEVLAAWSTLKFVDVQETKVTAKGVAGFRATRPDVKLLAGPFEAASGKNAG